MYVILIVTNEKERFSDLFNGFRGVSNCSVDWADSVEEAIKKASTNFSGLMILDQEVGGVSNLEMAHRMVLSNPMINLALVSLLSHEDFHEASEGLGILAQLPPNPPAQEAEKLLKAMEAIQPLQGG